MRRHVSYANVAATFALVFSMSGGALAAKHYLINSTSQISPKVLKKLKAQTGRNGTNGKNGATGATGPAGAKGEAGPPGAKGEPGQAGPFPTTLPSGRTITGSYAIVGGAASGSGNDWGASAISFPYPLASAPAVKVVRIGGPPQTGCSGTASSPTAAPGTLCVYEGGRSGISAPGYPDVCSAMGCKVVEGAAEASLTGAWVRVFASSNTVRWYDFGSWAVTG